MEKEDWKEIANTFKQGISLMHGGASVRLEVHAIKEIGNSIGQFIDGVPEINKTESEWSHSSHPTVFFIRVNSITELEADGLYTIVKRHDSHLLVSEKIDLVAERIGWKEIEKIKKENEE